MKKYSKAVIADLRLHRQQQQQKAARKIGGGNATGLAWNAGPLGVSFSTSTGPDAALPFWLQTHGKSIWNPQNAREENDSWSSIIGERRCGVFAISIIYSFPPLSRSFRRAHIRCRLKITPKVAAFLLNLLSPEFETLQIFRRTTSY